jgi:hypothetical protein
MFAFFFLLYSTFTFCRCFFPDEFIVAGIIFKVSISGQPNYFLSLCFDTFGKVALSDASQ